VPDGCQGALERICAAAVAANEIDSAVSSVQFSFHSPSKAGFFSSFQVLRVQPHRCASALGHKPSLSRHVLAWLGMPIERWAKVLVRAANLLGCEGGVKAQRASHKRRISGG
jgi:hypothetical protein